MASLLKSTRNTRALPIGTLRYIRSDAPVALTEEEIQWLLDNDVTTIVDLRSEGEITRKPCKLQMMEGFRYCHLPVTGNGAIPASIEVVHASYMEMLDAQMESIINTIMNADSNVMYFCTAGKDRTGVVSALILKRLGIDDEMIIDDYMQSKENLMEMLIAFAKENPKIDIEVITPHEENMRRLLKDIKNIDANKGDLNRGKRI